MDNYRNYWDTQFAKYNHIWGETPSKSAGIALSLFRQHEVNKILGSGFGIWSKQQIVFDIWF